MKKIFLQVNHDYVLYVLFVKVREGLNGIRIRFLGKEAKK